MKGRFSAAIVAFAVATAFVSSRPLPEFFVQLRDPNLVGGPGAAWLLHTFGFAFVLGLCAAISAAALLLASWRTRLRGASDWYVGLAATFIALCLTARIGVSLDPVAWLCAAAICLLLDRDDVSIDVVDDARVRRRALQAGLAAEVDRVHDERVAFPVSARIAHPLPHVLGKRGGAVVDRDDPRFVNHLVVNHHVARRLDDLVVAVVARLQEADARSAEGQAAFADPSIFGTIRRALAHSTGVQREPPGEVWETLEMPDRETLLGSLDEAEQVLEPGRMWHYSNLVYALLGEVIGRVSGVPAEQFVEERILRPLGLGRTTWGPGENAATGYFVARFADVAVLAPGASLADELLAERCCEAQRDAAQ